MTGYWVLRTAYDKIDFLWKKEGGVSRLVSGEPLLVRTWYVLCPCPGYPVKCRTVLGL